jgi:dCTP deaminase
MPLSDSQIEAAIKAGNIGVEPFDPKSIQPSSLDVHLGPLLQVAIDSSPIDLSSAEDIQGRYKQVGANGFVLQPGATVLGSTAEFIKFGRHCGLVLARSSLARLGLSCTLSGYANPGYEGNLPLVLTNLGAQSIHLVAGRRMAQVLFFPVSEVRRMYSERGGKYLNERGPTPSRLHLDDELKHLLQSLGVPSRQLDKTVEHLEQRLEEAAERRANSLESKGD